MRLSMLMIGAIIASGCSSVATVKEPRPAPAIDTLASLMSTADKALESKQTHKARESYRAAAAAYPSEHLPWVRLAQSHFDAGEYGSAIVAADEALQRSPHDQAALGISAVSGLRVSSRALSHLNDKQSLGDSRSQAESIVHVLRTTLGEASLVREREIQPFSSDESARAPNRHVMRTFPKPSISSQTFPTANPVSATASPGPTRTVSSSSAAEVTPPIRPATKKTTSSSANPLDLLR